MEGVGFVLFTGQNVLNCLKGGYHGMVDVVISVLSVTTYTVKIVDALQVFHQLIHLVICIEVIGIRLLHLFHMGIQYHIRAVNEAQIPGEILSIGFASVLQLLKSPAIPTDTA